MENEVLEARMADRRTRLARNLIKSAGWPLAVGAALVTGIWWLSHYRYTQFLWYALAMIPPIVIALLYPVFADRGKAALATSLFLSSLILMQTVVPLLIPEALLAMAVGHVLVPFGAGILLGSKKTLRFALVVIPALLVDILFSTAFHDRWFLDLDPVTSQVTTAGLAVFLVAVTIGLFYRTLSYQDGIFRQAQRAQLEIEQRMVTEQEHRAQLEQANQEIARQAQQEQDQRRQLLGLLGEIRAAASQVNTASSEILATTTQQATDGIEESAAIARASSTIDEIRSRVQLAPIGAKEISLLTAIADQLSTIIESEQLRQQASAAAILEERNRLASSLHDSVTQLLYSINLFARSGRNAYAKQDWDNLDQYLREVGETGQQALREMRLLIYELGPQALEQDILTGALQRRLDAVEGRVGIDAQLLLGKIPILPREVEEELYYIAIEALNNALKHAHATTVHVQLGLELEELHLEVIDNGVGFDPTAERSGGLGLLSMGERARRLGGQLTITSAVEVGTTIHLVVPWAASTKVQ